MPFLVKVVWNVWIPPKASFFCLGGVLGKALTLDQFQRRKWTLANRCFPLSYLGGVN